MERRSFIKNIGALAAKGNEKWISEMKELMKDKRDFIQICQEEIKI